VNSRTATVGGLWSGALGQRFDPPPAARNRPRFYIRPGVKCAIRNVLRGDWAPFTTRKAIGFERFETYTKDDGAGYYQFRHGVWLMLVSRRYVVHREDLVAAGVG
jgi:hypothetical protein